MQDIPSRKISDDLSVPSEKPGSSRRRRWILAVGGGLFALLAAALILPGFMDWSGYRAPLSAIARDILGQDVRLDGEIRLRLLPTPAFKASDVTIGPRGDGMPPLARIDRFDIAIDFLSLLEGSIAVKRLSLFGPDIHLSHDEDLLGRGKGGEERGDGLAIEHLRIRDGRLRYDGGAEGPSYDLSEIRADLSIGGAKGPFRASGTAQVSGHGLIFDLDSRKWIAGERVPLVLSLGLDGSRLALAGWLRDGDGIAIGGRLDLSGKDLPALIAALSVLSGEVSPVFPAMPERSFRLRGEFAAGPDTIRLDDLGGTVLGMRLNGRIEGARAPAPRIAVDLGLDRVALDPWFAAGPQAVQDEAGIGVAPLEALAPLLASNLALSIDLAADAVGYRDMLATSVRLLVKRDAEGGPLRLEQFESTLPGAGHVTLDGTIGRGGSGVALDARIAFATGSLRALLKSLAIDPGYPPDMLTQARLDGVLKMEGPLSTFRSTALSLDRMTGSLTLRHEGREKAPDRFHADLKLDSLDLDSWLPPASDAPMTLEQALAQLARFAAAIPDLEPAVTFESARLIHGKRDYRDSRLSVALGGGRLAIDSVRLNDASGATFGARGHVAIAAPNDFRFETTLALPDPAKSLAAIGIAAPIDPAPLGEATVSALLEGTPASISISADLSTTHGSASLIGRVANAEGRVEAFDLEAKADIDSHCRLRPHFSCEASGPLSAPGSLTLSLEGQPENFALDLGLAAFAGGKLEAKGTISGQGEAARAHDLRITLSHPSAARALALLRDDPAPVSGPARPIALEARLAGDGRKDEITIARARYGTMDAKGRIGIDRTGARPYIDADIRVDMPPPYRKMPRITARGIPAPPRPYAGNRWSQAAIDLSALRDIDGKFLLKAAHLGSEAWQFEAVDTEFQLEQGVFRIVRGAARLFDGTIALDGTLDARAIPTLVLDARLDDLELERLLDGLGGLSALRGRASGTAHLKTMGESEFELVRNLEGTASLVSRGGQIVGIDLRTLAAGLSTASSPGDMPRLIAQALQDGETGFRDFGASFSIENGVVRTDDIRAATDFGTATARGTIDLPAWSLAMESRLALDPGGKLPPLDVDIRGNLAQPKIVFDQDSLMRWAATRFGSRTIEKLIPQNPAIGLPDIFGGRKTPDEPKREPPPR